MTANIKQIAQIAGVSRGTVDRALNERPGVNQEVAARIKEIAHALNYKPNKVAKAFATRNRGRKIGVVINSEGNPFFDEVLQGIYSAAAEVADFGTQVVVKRARGYDVSRQIDLIDELELENISMLAITPIDDAAVADKLNQLIDGGTQVVTFNTDILSARRLAYVGCNYRQSGNTAAGLLGMITGGQAGVGIVTGSLKILGHHQRIEGFKETVRADFPGIRVEALVENNDNDEISYLRVKEMLANHPGITALYFSAAGIEGGMQAVQELGGQRTLKIITVDLIPAVQQWLKEGLVAATICQEPYRQGYETIKLMFNVLVTGDQLESTVVHTENKIMLKYNLV